VRQGRSSTTPAAERLCNNLPIIVLRPPLLQKEGKVLWTNWISTSKSVCLYWSSQ